MTRQRLLTDPDEIAASDEFKRLLRLSNKTQDQVGAEIGNLTQGTVWQWANRRLAIPAEHARAAAAAVGADPSQISVAWRKLNVVSQHTEDKSPSPLVYQPARLSVSKVIGTTSALKTFLKRRGLEYDPVEDAELFVAAYTEAEKLSESPSQDETLAFASVVVDLIQAREARKSGRSNSDQTDRRTGSKDRKSGSSM